MKQVMCFTAQSGDDSSSPVYGSLLGGVADWGDYLHSPSAVTRLPNIILRACVLSKLLIVLKTDAPGVGRSRTFTVIKNDLDTIMAITIADNNESGADNVNELELVEDDLVAISMTQFNSPAALNSFKQLSYLLDTIGSKYSQYFFNSSNTQGNTTPVYHGVFNSTDIATLWSFELDTAYDIAPTNGNIRGYGVNIQNRSIITSSGYYVIVKNGIVQDGSSGTVDTRKTYALLGNQYYQIKKTDFTLPFVVGDELAIKHAHNNEADSATCHAVTMLVESEIAGESIWAIHTSEQNTAGSGYPGFHSPTSAKDTEAGIEWTATEANAQVKSIPQSFALIKLTAKALETFGTASDTRTLVSRIGGVSGALTVTLLGDSTDYVRDAIHSQAVVDTNEVAIMQSRVGSISVGFLMRMSMVQYIAPNPSDATTGLGIITPGTLRDIFNNGLEVAIPTPFFITYLQGDNK